MIPSAFREAATMPNLHFECESKEAPRRADGPGKLDFAAAISFGSAAGRGRGSVLLL